MPGPTNEFDLGAPLAVAMGIRPRTLKGLLELGVKNVGQLVAHLPMRHEREEAEATIDQLVANTNITARGTITATRVVRKPGVRPRFEAVLVDETGRLDLVWFNGLYMAEKVQPGVRLLVMGKAKRFGQGLQLANPKTQVIRPDAEEKPAAQSRLRPVYPASGEVNSAAIEQAVAAVLPRALPLIEDHLPMAFRAARSMPDLAEAHRLMHQPTDESQVALARRRLAYDELLLLQLGLALKRREREGELLAPVLPWSEALDARIRERFPFALTEQQNGVVRELAADLGRTIPANRLIQGDVGSGKTVVALYALLMAVAAGRQGALMAPTELLAEQHFGSIGRMLAGSKVRLELLTGSLPEAERRRVARGLAEGTVDLVVGTHALLTEGVEFKSLAVAVVDEQHRFGVHQRATLRAKGADAAGVAAPHILVMTATPIPRSLALTLFGDLDVSTIRGLPPGRRPVATRVVGPEKRDTVYQFVRQRIDGGEQAYVVVPSIEQEADLFPTDPGSRLRSVREVAAELESGPLMGRVVAELHGRLARETRERIMDRFRRGEVHCLVATTVIEVGVDVANATVMVVEDADRFGLAQLHQLRGRVGRGGKSSACVLVGRAVTDDAAARLEVMRTISDGFALAEQDMAIRGFGQVIGTRQSGMPPFKVADLARDMDLLQLARRDAASIVQVSPGLDRPEDRLLRRRLLKAHGPWLGLADVG